MAPVVVPPELLCRVDRTQRFEYVVLGAGCSGLTIALALIERGVSAPILLIDPRTSYEDDRTWCFWDVEPTRFTDLAASTWHTCLVSAGDRTASATSGSFPYRRLTAAAFYVRALNMLAQHPRVSLALGEKVMDFREGLAETAVRTDRGEYRARYVIDARGLPPDSATMTRVRASSTWIPQHFLGQRISADRPVFSPDACMLMDFRVEQTRGLRFVYVLPISSTQALVENVYMADTAVTAQQHRAEIRRYLEDVYGLTGQGYRVDGEEAGTIPMTDHRFPCRTGERAYAVGALAGSIRPSSGYAFLRIQRSAAQLADALTQPRAAPRRTWRTRRSAVLDAVFLRFLAQHPAEGPEVFRRMFDRTDSDSLIRFLSDRSSVVDELRLIGALPKTRFVLVALRTLGSRARARR